MLNEQLLKSLSIVILDDDDLILDVTQIILENLGINDIATFISASEALSSLAVNDPNTVLLCDLNMPEMNGMEVMRHLEQLKYAGAVILLSGEDIQTLQAVVSNAKIDHLRLLGVLTKPVHPEVLAMMLNTLQSH